MNAEPRPFVCGTRKVVRRDAFPGSEITILDRTLGTYRVDRVPLYSWSIVCASCDGGGSRRFRTREEALAQCVKSSGNPCRICGAS